MGTVFILLIVSLQYHGITGQTTAFDVYPTESISPDDQVDPSNIRYTKRLDHKPNFQQRKWLRNYLFQPLRNSKHYVIPTITWYLPIVIIEKTNRTAYIWQRSKCTGRSASRCIETRDSRSTWNAVSGCYSI